MESCCAVCAEPLKFCAFGPCHHQEVCSLCMARLRYLKNDKTCPICRHECPVIFVTRHLDNNYTKRVGKDQWAELEEKAKSPRHPELIFMKKINAIFDDIDQYRELDRMLGLTHPKLEEVTDVSKLTIKGIKDLKRIIDGKLNLSFCDLCLKHRPVFIPEQMLYTKAELHVHNTKGDPDGPLKEANFKGHPRCNFCKINFYDETALYKHMEQTHYHCHICRRENPEKHVYFPDYDKLEEHFEKEHFLCPFDECRQQRFIVFSTEAELKRHMMTAHAGENAHMKRHERRAALTLETGFMAAPRHQGHHHHHHHGHHQGPEVQTMMRPPTVIGGGGAGSIVADMRSRAQADDVARMHAASAAAAEHRQAQLDLNAELHFPELGPNAAPAALMHRGWVGGPASRQVMNASFPTLGEGLSRGQKKKMKAKAKRSGAAEGFGSTSERPPAEVMAMGMDDAVVREVDERSPVPSPRPAPTRPVSAASPALGQPPGLTQDRAGPSRPCAQTQPAVQNAFERLAMHDPEASPARPGSAGRGGTRPAAQPDFPALGGAGAQAHSGPAVGGWVSAGNRAGNRAAPQPQVPSRPVLSAAESFPALQGRPGSGPGKGKAPVQAANDLFRKLQSKMLPRDYAELKQVTRGLENGHKTAQEYHDTVVCLGLAADVVQLMSVLKVPKARDAVLAVHADYISNGMPGQGGAFVPPEAILAAAHAGGGRQVWQCYICDTMNEMGMEKCKHCNTPKQISDAQEAEMRDAAEKAEQARATVQGGKKKKARAKPMTFQDINRSAAVAHSAWRPK